MSIQWKTGLALASLCICQTELLSQSNSGATTPNAVIKTVGTREVKETSLGSVESIEFDQDSRAVPRYWISADGKRFAREVDHGAKLMVDGRLIEQSLKEGSFVFSQDSQHFAYVAVEDKSESLILDGKTLGSFAVVQSPIRFSPDGQHVACIAAKLGDSAEMRSIVLDGIVVDSNPNLGRNFAFEGDSKSLLYIIAEDNSNSLFQRPVAVGSERTKLNHGVADLASSFFYGPQRQIGYVAKFGEHEFGVIYDGRDDGQRLQEIRMQNIVVSRDGKQVAYVGDSSPVKNVAVHLGKRGNDFNPFENGRIVDSTIQISPDGSRVAYIVEQDQKQYCVIDGKPGPKYEAVDLPEFSSDSQHVSYIAMKGQSPVVVIDGVESRQYAMVSQPEFTTDGKNHAYYAELGGRQFMVLNGKKGGDYDAVQKPEFNKGGSKLIYGATLNDRDFMVVNGKKQKEYLIAGALEYLADGERFAYLAVDSRNREMIVVDQNEGGQYDRILAREGKAIYVTAPDRFHYLALKKNELFLIEERLR